MVAAGAASAPETSLALAFGAPRLEGVGAGLRGTDGERDGLDPYLFDDGPGWPALRFQARAPLDWTGAAALVVPVRNPADTPFVLLVRLDDSVGADGGDRSLTGLATLAPHQRATVVLPLGAAPPGMRGRPPSGLALRAGDLVMPDVRGTVDLRHVVAMHLSGTPGAGDRTLLIGTPMLRHGGTDGPPSADGPIADGFGQAIQGAWPEKVLDEADLARKLDRAADEVRRLAAAAPQGAGHWGGVAGPAQAATGFFHTAQAAGGRWMLVTPDGHPFFSLGVDAVTSANPTIVAGREALFAGLPRPGDPLSRFYGLDEGRRTFDIGNANLARGLGPDWRSRWPAATVGRLQAWGFNTLGTWSEAALAPALPHVAFTDVEGASAAVPMGGRNLPDPFDPRFATVADEVAAVMAAAGRGDAGLIGYFSGNELPWGEADRPAEGLAAHVLRLEPASPARRALVEDLQARYPNPAAWSEAWGLPRPDGWDAPVTVPAAPTAAALADMARFEGRFASRYFATVAAALKRHDPDHLYLGTRFASATPAVVAACARWCDVLSFNVYGPTPDARAALWRGLDRPVLIGEFHFGSLDRGSFWPGMQAVPAEADRGPAYAVYLRAALADPAIVGVAWYQYADEPLTGRPYDGENGHIGLVAVTDVPYAGFVDAVAAANRKATAAFVRQLEAVSGARRSPL